jgi:hypothetical protein
MRLYSCFVYQQTSGNQVISATEGIQPIHAILPGGRRCVLGIITIRSSNIALENHLFLNAYDYLSYKPPFYYGNVQVPRLITGGYPLFRFSSTFELN